MFEADKRQNVEAAIWRAVAAVNVHIGSAPDARFAPIGEAKPDERVTISGRDYEEMAESVCCELARCGLLAASTDQNVAVGRIMRARRMKLNSKWQIHDPQAILPAEIFVTLMQAGMLIEHASVSA